LPEGAIGRQTGSPQVLLLSDKESGVGALLSGTRTQGPVRGSGDPDLQMEYVSNETPVTAGQFVFTSGQDRIFPKDLPVGTVVSVKPGVHSPFQEIAIRPAAHLDQLEEVLVLLTRKDFSTSFNPAAAAASAQAVPAFGAPSAVTPAASAPAAAPTGAPAAASAPAVAAPAAASAKALENNR